MDANHGTLESEQKIARLHVLNEVLNVMHTAIFNPNYKDGKFVESIVSREKEMIKQRIESVFDDKSRYAYQRLLQILRPDEPASISA